MKETLCPSCSLWFSPGLTPGRETLVQALKRLRDAPTAAGEMPKPDDPWGAWVEYRMDRLESQQTWLMRLLCGTLAVQVGLKVLEMVN